MAGERWYEFEQVEVIRRPFFVKASSLAEARGKVRARRAGWDGDDGVPDYVPGLGPDSIRVAGRGRLADQEVASSRAAELEL